MNVRSPVRRTARLLTLLLREDGLNATEISRRLDLPYTTCHRLLLMLADEELVSRGVGKVYRISASR